MDDSTSQAIQVLQFLLPGFISAWIFYSLTSYPRPSQFERGIQALIFTTIIQAGSQLVIELFDDVDLPSPLIMSTIYAVLLGALLSYFSNSDALHKCLRKVHLTRETSFPSEWYGAFLQDITYVVLHLNDERRLYGWPMEWPSEAEKGHFVLAQATWLNDDSSETAITGVSKIVIGAKEVRWVEFMEKSWE